MGKLEKRYLLLSNCKYFDKTGTEMFHKKSCPTHIILALCSFVLFVMETINAKKWIKKIFKKLPPETTCSMKLRLYRNIHHITMS